MKNDQIFMTKYIKNSFKVYMLRINYKLTYVSFKTYLCKIIFQYQQNNYPLLCYLRTKWVPILQFFVLLTITIDNTLIINGYDSKLF